MKKVVYTSLFGNYDFLKDPEIIDPDWDYICFSNHLKQVDFKVWKIRKIDQDNLTNIEASRLPKLCPHLVLQGYEISLYIDSNIIISSDFVYVRAKQLEQDIEAIISIPKHPTRNCLYKEAEILKYRGKDKPQNIDRQIKMMQESGFPTDYGLFENNVIWRRHQDTRITTMGAEWWRLFLEYSKRDQLGLAYCLWKYNIHCIPLMPSNILDHRKCEHFEFSNHNSSTFLPVKRLVNKIKFVIRNGSKPK